MEARKIYFYVQHFEITTDDSGVFLIIEHHARFLSDKN